MFILIGDIGNTITKICLINEKTYRVNKFFYLNTKDIHIKSLFVKKINKILKGKKFIKVALFSSVIPSLNKVLNKLFKKNYGINYYEISNKSINKIIKINIKNKNQVGSDRIANATGAYKKYKSNCIILDFGTATTFDVVTRDGIYNGGVIAPGVNLSINSLADVADQIPLFSLKKEKKIIGKNTLEALRSGFYWGYSGLINNIILKIEKETKKKYTIIFTGGYAELFKSSIIRSFKIDRNITMTGIIEIFKKNRKKLI